MKVASALEGLKPEAGMCVLPGAGRSASYPTSNTSSQVSNLDLRPTNHVTSILGHKIARGC